MNFFIISDFIINCNGSKNRLGINIMLVVFKTILLEPGLWPLVSIGDERNVRCMYFLKNDLYAVRLGCHMNGITDSMKLNLGTNSRIGEGQGCLVCCIPWSLKKLDMAWQLNTRTCSLSGAGNQC